MTINKRILATIAGALLVLTMTAGCATTYVPTVKTGWCNQGREWVPPAKDANGDWKEGYCRDKSVSGN